MFLVLVALAPSALLIAPTAPSAGPRGVVTMTVMQASQIAVGQAFPDTGNYINIVTDGCVREDACPMWTVEDLVGSESNKKLSVIVGMPGAFTPTCTDLHLPSYIRSIKKFEKLGVKTVAVLTTNDRFIMSSWKDAMKECMRGEGLRSLDDRVTFVADKGGEITKALGLLYNSKLEAQAGPKEAGPKQTIWQMFNAGLRSKRFALVVKDGVVKHVAVDEDTTGTLMEATSADAVLAVLGDKGAASRITQQQQQAPQPGAGVAAAVASASAGSTAVASVSGPPPVATAPVVLEGVAEPVADSGAAAVGAVAVAALAGYYYYAVGGGGALPF